MVTTTTSDHTPVGPAGTETTTDDWWSISERLADLAQDVAGVELAASARTALVEATVELLVLLTCWPGSPTPADRLAYLRARRARMEKHASWFYALPRPTRSFLAGTRRRPALVVFAVKAQPVEDALRRAWRKGLLALGEHVANRDKALNEVMRLAGPVPALPSGAHELGRCPRARCLGGAVASKWGRRGRPQGTNNRRHSCPVRNTGVQSESAAPGGRVTALAPGMRARHSRPALRGPPDYPRSSGRGPPQVYNPVPVCLGASFEAFEMSNSIPTERAGNAYRTRQPPSGVNCYWVKEPTPPAHCPCSAFAV